MRILDAIINKLTSYPLSAEDMMKLCDGETKIVAHEELHNVDNIFELLEPYNNFVLLYETEPNYGHWVCVIYHPEENTIEFFDPYGMFIDEQLDYIKDDSISDEPILSMLMLNTDCKIIYNNKPLQKFDKNISSCGRHVGLRVNCRDMPLDKYQDMLMSENKNERDKIVTMLTSIV